MRLLTALLICPFALAACSSDSDDPGTTGDNSTAGCDIVVEPSDDDTRVLQTAVIEASSNSTVCIKAGSYSLTKELAIGATPGLTIRGLGETPDDTVLDFKDQTEGDDGMTATGDNFTIENLHVKNTPGNGIVVSGATGVTYRKIKITWDGDPRTENGAYAIYPTHSENILVEDCEVYGASDAGVYVGQSKSAIVRRNTAYGNVIGIEVENTTGAEIYENTAYDNTTGIFVPLLPNLEKKDSVGTAVYDNMLRENNRTNFGPPGSVVSALPPGVGILILNADDTRIWGNTIEKHVSTGVAVVSQEVMDEATGKPSNDTETDGYPERTYIHGNTFIEVGTAPTGILAALGASPMEHIVWDGQANPAGAGAEFCLGDSPPSFRNFNGIDGVSMPEIQSTDASPYDCTLPDLDPISF